MSKAFNKSISKQRVILGMSGGIDSTISVIRLQKQGYIVVGVTFIFAPNFNNNSEIPTYAKEAKLLASKLQIEHHIVDLRAEFKDSIVDSFFETYLQGETPFPCALCNKKMKWHHLYAQMQKHQCNYMATGHYAQKVNVNGALGISKHPDDVKDQTYFLWGIPSKFLPYILFPIQDITKTEVRKVAKQYKLTQFEAKKESFGVCFAPDGDYLSYMKQHLPEVSKKIKPGNFILESGKIVGRHKGLMHYTVGQRNDLNLYTDEKLYVKEIRSKNNQIVVAPKNRIICKEVILKQTEIHLPERLSQPELNIKVAYRGALKKGSVCQIGNHLKITFQDASNLALAPGQTAVIYHDDVVVAGGFIHQTL